MPAPTNNPVINSLEFARKALEIHDTIAISQFPRLREYLVSTEGALNYRLFGVVNAGDEPRLQLRITGSLQLSCQRCLEPFAFKLDIASIFIVVADENAIPAEADEQDDIDYLVEDAQMSVMALIEDAVLLALPLAPKHDDAQCAASAKLNELKKPSPFAVLKALKTGKSQN